MIPGSVDDSPAIRFITRMEIDLNCDLGEGCPHDAELMSLITSANIACGFHAGDSSIAFATLAAAGRHKVQIGMGLALLAAAPVRAFRGVYTIVTRVYHALFRRRVQDAVTG